MNQVEQRSVRAEVLGKTNELNAAHQRLMRAAEQTGALEAKVSALESKLRCGKSPPFLVFSAPLRWSSPAADGPTAAIGHTGETTLRFVFLCLS